VAAWLAVKWLGPRGPVIATATKYVVRAGTVSAIRDDIVSSAVPADVM